MTYRLAVVGLGKIAHDQHLPCIAGNGDFELAAVVSSRGGLPGVASFKTLAELIASGMALDAISLCMPPEPRFAAARDCLAAGYNLLLEKPPAPTVGEVTALAELGRAANRVVFTTWHSQYNAAVDEARRQLKGRRITRLHVEWKEDVRHWHPGQDWIWEPGGFGVFDPGINAFSIVTTIMPKPLFVERVSLETPANRATPIAAEIRFKPSWDGQADLTASLDWRQTGEQSWNIDVETSDGLSLQLRKGGTELFAGGKPVVAEPSEEYQKIYRHFAQLLKSSASHVDVAPLQLVNDCMMLGRRVDCAPFNWA